MSNALKNKLLAAFSKKSDNSIFPKFGKTVFDLSKIIDEKELLNWINNVNCKKVKLSILDNKQKIMEQLNNCKSYDEIKNLFLEYNIEITKTLINGLKTNFQKYLPKAVEKLINANATNKNILNLSKIANDKFKDTGMWYLYVGIYYLSGYIIDNNEPIPVNAPMVVLPVEIKKDSKNGDIYLEKIDEEYFSNNKLNYLLNTTFDLKIEDFETSNINEFNQYNDYLKSYCNEFNFTPSKFIEFNANPIIDKPVASKWEVYPYITISLMDPNGGIILKDVTEINELGKDPFSSGSLLKNDEYISNIIDNDNLIAINHNPNIYQKYAINAALNENTLIYGPPGTGKSEVIANIIANIIYNNKNVLMCSEKKAALDVLVERLGPLDTLAINIYDSKNRSLFFEKIKNIYEIINSFMELDEQLLKGKIKKNDIEKLNEIQKVYLMDNELLALNLKNDISCFFSQSYDELYNKCFGITINNWEKENNKLLTFEEHSLLLDKTKYYYDFYLQNADILNALKMNNLILNRKIINDFLTIYDAINPKYKNFFLNQFLNTGKMNKPNLFNKKIHRHWQVYNDSYLEKLRQLINYKNYDIDPSYIINKKDMYEKMSPITNDKIILYHELIKVTEIFNKYGFHKETYINKKINDYYTINENNSHDNALFILNWYLSKIVKYIKDLEALNTVDNVLFNSIKEVFKVSKLKRYPAVTTFIKKHYEALRFLFPIWIMSPIEISINTPNQENVFDYGIFDEASQMLVENSYPAVYRCKKVCVAGDDKQLKPTTFFTNQYIVDDDEMENDENYVLVSLLDKAKISLWYEFNLKNHYRSNNAKLIEFSNHYIYNDSLKTATKNGCFENPIEVHNLNGIWDGTYNLIEIGAIIKYIEKHYTKQSLLKNESWLIITCNIKQKEKLENTFNLESLKNDTLREAYEKDLIKFRNIENVQGDETDIVLLSLTYGPNKENKVIQNFGPFNRNEGPNRLNVAITRSKERLIIFKSLYADMIPNTTNNDNIEIFKKFIQFVDDNAIKENQNNNTFLNVNNNEINFDSDIAKDIYKKLNNVIDQYQYQILTNFLVGSKYIDIVVIDKKNNKVAIGLEIDLTKYHSNFKQVMENIDYQNFLEIRGYKIYRIKEIDWKSDYNNVINNILKLMTY